MKTIELFRSQFDMSGIATRIRSMVGGNKAIEVIQGFENFINNDTTLLQGIQRILLRRLKYSTGKLYNSIGLECKIDYETVPGVRRQSKARIAQNFEMVKSNLNISITLKNHMLINALLGEDEAKTPVPSVYEITKWIRGKKQYFRSQLTDIQSRNRITRALYRQRNILISEKTLDKDIKEPTKTLAEEIVRNMKRRFEDTGSATKGSEYTLLGYKDITTKTGIEMTVARYKKYSKPLLSQSESINDEISFYIMSELQKYAEGVFYPTFDTKFTRGITAKGIENRAEAVTSSDFMKVFSEGVNNVQDIVDALSLIKGKKIAKLREVVTQDLNKYRDIETEILLDLHNKTALDPHSRHNIYQYRHVSDTLREYIRHSGIMLKNFTIKYYKESMNKSRKKLK